MLFNKKPNIYIIILIYTLAYKNHLHINKIFNKYIFNNKKIYQKIHKINCEYLL